jgi:amino acid adenylation domain-containing protein
MTIQATNLQSDRERSIRSATTWVELVRRRAELMNDRSAYTFLVDGEQDEQRLTYGALDRSARALAAEMMSSAEPGQRALLLVPPGPDFVRAFFACLYAGVIAVPVPLPSSKRGLPRVLSIVRDCRPSVMISTRGFLTSIADERGNKAIADLRALRLLAIEDVQECAAPVYRRPPIDGGTIAFLQYTSGSTGTPKGVVLTHDNLLANERAIASAFEHDEQSVIVGWLPPFHDMGLIGNVLQPIFVGAQGVHMTPQHFLTKPLRWLSAISRYRATTSGGPNFAYELCLQKIGPDALATLDLSSWKVAFNGAEPVRATTLARFGHTFAGTGFAQSAFYPCYGLAEATLLVSGGAAQQPASVAAVDARALESGRLVRAADGADAREVVGAGVAREIELRIVRPETREPCGPGEVGEIWLRGANVASGYWQRELDDERTFGARTLDDEGPFMRTGDLGGCLGEELYITGRLKDLIVLRGRNLYPQDLELAAQQSCPETRGGGAAAFSLEPEQSGTDERIVIVQELAGRRSEQGEMVALAIREAIAQQFGVSLHAVVLIAGGTLPRTTSGKVQRSTTRARWLEGTLHVRWNDLDAASHNGGGAPQTELERTLAAIWEDVLSRPRGTLERRREFVRLGGDSLQATQIAARVNDALALSMNGVQLFESSTIEALAQWIETRGTCDASTSEPEDGAPPTRVPLSFVQERLWFLEQLADGEPVQHVAGAIRIRGSLDRAALERAIHDLCARHAALRTRFAIDHDGTYQFVLPPMQVALPVIEAHGRPLAELVHDLRIAFDLRNEAPARFRLLRESTDQHALVFVGHHLVLDGWSTALLARDLFALYRAQQLGGSADLAPIATSYADFARAERRGDPAESGARAFWQRCFERPLPVLDLPTDRPRGALQTHRGARHVVALPHALTSALSAIGRAHDATPFMTLTAAFAALLSRYTGQRDLCLGTPVMVRRTAAQEQIVGCFLNTLPLRIDLTGEPSFVRLLERVREVVVSAQTHRDLPFDRLLELVAAPRDLARSPLFQVMIAMQPVQGSPIADRAGWSVEQLDTHTAQFDLSLDLIPEADGSLRAAWEYNRDLFDGESIASMARAWLALLAELARKPSLTIEQIPWLSSEQLEIYRPAPAAEAPLPVHLQFERAARRAPDALALVCGDERLTYGALNARANQLARALRNDGLSPEERVAVYSERSAALVIAVLAVLKAGGAYVSLDVTQPPERTRAVLADAGVTRVLASEESAASLADLRKGRQLRTIADCHDPASPDTNLGLSVHPGQLAYLLYTSGSTGRPKGVAIPHGALANTLAGWRAAYGHCIEAPRVLSLASPAFDVWTADWVRALCQGGTLFMGDASLAYDPRSLTERLRRERITLVDVVPAQVESLMSAWRDESPELDALRLLVVGSDVWSLATLRALRERLPQTCRLLSCYGVTEAAIDSAWFEHAEAGASGGDGSVPLGGAFAGTGLYVLDARGQPVPDGVAGELAIGGAGLARGYLGQAALTAERFVPDVVAKEPGARMYRTGDRVRRDRTGALTFLGRLDAQVKVRGVRVELGEIETCLVSHASVRAACVAVRSSEDAHSVLVAYLVLEAGAALDEACLRAALRARLPEAMHPAAFVAVPALPLSANGKVDRRALPPFEPSAQPRAQLAGPRSPLERGLAEIWRELLPGREVSVHDNFFDLGGHSLLFAQVQSRIAAQLSRDVPVLTLLQHPTIAALAQALEDTQPRLAETARTAESAPERGPQARRAELLARRRPQRSES